MEIKFRRDFYKLLPPNPVTVELGVAEGLFSEEICNWNPSLHYAVDNWATYGSVGDASYEQAWHNKNMEQARERLLKFPQVIIHRGLTWHVADYVKDNTVDFVYVDAGHDFDSVTKDIHAWFSKLKIGGIMAFHDWFSRAYGVRDAVQFFCAGKYIIYEVPENNAEDGSCYFIKS